MNAVTVSSSYSSPAVSMEELELRRGAQREALWQSLPIQERERLTGTRILVVDDVDLDVQEIMKKLEPLLPYAEVVTTVSADEALKMLADAAHGVDKRPFDILITDLAMQTILASGRNIGMNGDMLLRAVEEQFRAQPELLPAVVVHSGGLSFPIKAFFSDSLDAMRRIDARRQAGEEASLGAELPITKLDKHSSSVELLQALSYVRLMRADIQEAVLAEYIQNHLGAHFETADSDEFHVSKLAGISRHVGNRLSNFVQDVKLAGLEGELGQSYRKAEVLACELQEMYRFRLIRGTSGEFARHNLGNCLGRAVTLLRVNRERSPLLNQLIAEFNKDAQHLVERYHSVNALRYQKGREGQNVELALQAAIKEYVPEFDTARIQVTGDAGGLLVNAPNDLLGQIFLQPIQNALKFSDTPVQVQISQVSENELPDSVKAQLKPHGFELYTTVRISVIDHGVGISAANLARIFEPGFSTSALATGQRSTGWGLSFLREQLPHCFGAVNVESNTEGSEQGTRFHLYFAVPLEPADSATRVE